MAGKSMAGKSMAGKSMAGKSAGREVAGRSHACVRYRRTSQSDTEAWYSSNSCCLTAAK